MSTVRNPDRADAPSHVGPTPPPKLAPADDPQWAMTLHLADLARAARPTTTEETTAMPTTNDPAELARRLDQLSADHTDTFERIDQRAEQGEDIESDDDEQRHQSIGKAEAYGRAAAMVREVFPPVEVPHIDPGYIAENFAEMHRDEAHRRAWLATVDPLDLARYVFDDIGCEVFDEAIATAAYRMGYADPAPTPEPPTFPTDGSMETAP